MQAWWSRWAAFSVVGLVAFGFGGCGGADGETLEETATESAAQSDGDASGTAWNVEEALRIEYNGPPIPADFAEAQALVKGLREKYNTTNVPDVLAPPYEPDAVLDYARAIKAFHVARPIDIAWLEALDVAALPRGERDNHFILESEVKSLLSRLKDYFPNEVAHSVKYTNANLIGTLNNSLDMVANAAAADLNDELKLKNLFARPERVQMIHEFADDARKLIPLAELLDAEFGEGVQDWDAKRQQVVDDVAAFGEKVHAAARMIVPPDDIGDAELRAAAQDVLSNERYGVGEWKRLIVNAPVRRYNRTLYTIDEHTIHRGQSIWEEFQATTIELEPDGNHYLFYNDIVRYEQAASRTPTGKWLLGKRFRGSPILEENIGE